MDTVYYHLLSLATIFIFFVNNDAIPELLANCMKGVCYSLKSNKGYEKRMW